jgi:hypothetical protein
MAASLTPESPYALESSKCYVDIIIKRYHDRVFLILRFLSAFGIFCLRFSLASSLTAFLRS